jgi:hypothetical protein
VAAGPGGDTAPGDLRPPGLCYVMSCPFCDEVPLTHWYDNTHERFRILDCPECGRPVVIDKVHRRRFEREEHRQAHIWSLREYGARFFHVDIGAVTEGTCAKGHIHAHIGGGDGL